MCGRAVSRGENLPRDDEGRYVRTKIGEEVRQTVKRDECLGFALMISVRVSTGIDASCQGHINELFRRLLMGDQSTYLE